MSPREGRVVEDWKRGTEIRNAKRNKPLATTESQKEVARLSRESRTKCWIKNKMTAGCWGANSDTEESPMPAVKFARKMRTSSVAENNLLLISVLVTNQLAGICRCAFQHGNKILIKCLAFFSSFLFKEETGTDTQNSVEEKTAMLRNWKILPPLYKRATSPSLCPLYHDSCRLISPAFKMGQLDRKLFCSPL